MISLKLKPQCKNGDYMVIGTTKMKFTKASFKYYFSQTSTIYYQNFKKEKIVDLVVSIASPFIEKGLKHVLNAEE